MRKQDRDRFVEKVTALLLELGAEQVEDRFILQTKVGELSLRPEPNRAVGLATVFTRFDNPQAARQFVQCNPFSGKWNHHYFDGWTVETALADFTSSLRMVLA